MSENETGPIARIKKSEERGLADFGWLKSRHTFSFGEYYDPAYMGFRSLRVINDDRVAAGKGFGTHPHDNMEIISYVVDGALEHKDSMGTGSVIRPGDVQIMSAGTGVTHSEFNSSDKKAVHFLQVWIKPGQRDLAPSYGQKHYPREDKQGRFCLIGSPDGREGSLVINQDVNLYAGLFAAGEVTERQLDKDRHVWVQLVSGSLKANDTELNTGDGLSLSNVEHLRVVGLQDAEVLVFDLA